MSKKIVMNESIAGYLENGHPFGYAPGSTQEVSDEIASAWVQAGLASWPAKEAKVVLKAETAVAKAPEVSKPVEVKTEAKAESTTESK